MNKGMEKGEKKKGEKKKMKTKKKKEWGEEKEVKKVWYV